MKKLVLALIASGICSISMAGINGLTSHSRANCGNNESIDWDATGNHFLCTISDHFQGGRLAHEINTGWASTWRSAAVHWGESSPGGNWYVIGTHWEIVNRVPQNIAYETVYDCAIYDGWWDNRTAEQTTRPEIVLTQTDIDKMKKVPKGISIVPFNETIIPEVLKKQMLRDKLLFSSMGYEKSNSTYPKTLLQIGRDKKTVINNDPADTHLKDDISNLGLGFKFDGIKSKDIDVVGYSVIGTYVKNIGWSGALEIFNTEIGTCKYSVKNVALSQASAQIPKEEVTYKINNKPTITNISGSVNTGFLYSAQWFDDNYFSSLDCANTNFDKSFMSKLIEIAKKVDKQ